MYRSFFKRAIDFTLALCAIIGLFPLLVILMVIGYIKMKGNPFFTQQRPGLNGKIFKLIKFRTMTNEKDSSGNLLPDEQRVNAYGNFLRSTSLDELGELINILKGDMSIIGPRPLLVSYLDYYTEEESHRHDVRPGLTGLAQAKGRSFITWEETFAYDLYYVENLSFKLDLQIFFLTINKVLNRADVADVSTIEDDEDGQSYVYVNGVRTRIHQPLDIERKKINAK